MSAAAGKARSRRVAGGPRATAEIAEPRGEPWNLPLDEPKLDVSAGYPACPRVLAAEHGRDGLGSARTLPTEPNRFPASSRLSPTLTIRLIGKISCIRATGVVEEGARR
ncbi:hypothetical protein AAFF_G00241410 [Aldrovandia affinis]|uniref:Uncharacterized protein n=1 Tax=Aldrovandia affinis TaxID=143900 RepID=A0AAD7SUW9_9TELE|nr:hypothetical protein AAFF_G00241410 [Aldrovandia affinis]